MGHYEPYAICKSKDSPRSEPFLWYTTDACHTTEEALKSIQTIRETFICYSAWIVKKDRTIIHHETYVNSIGVVRPP